jgi:hypothetical protein
MLVWVLVACAPTFTEVRDDILLPSCSLGNSCHSEGAGGLTLTEDGAFDALVNVASVVLPDETLVIPGNSDESYLIRKVEWADDVEGEGMPLGTTLSQENSQIIRDWIDAGAENN